MNDKKEREIRKLCFQQAVQIYSTIMRNRSATVINKTGFREIEEIAKNLFFESKAFFSHAGPKYRLSQPKVKIFKSRNSSNSIIEICEKVNEFIEKKENEVVIVKPTFTESQMFMYIYYRSKTLFK